MSRRDDTPERCEVTDIYEECVYLFVPPGYQFVMVSLDCVGSIRPGFGSVFFIILLAEFFVQILGKERLI